MLGDFDQEIQGLEHLGVAGGRAPQFSITGLGAATGGVVLGGWQMIFLAFVSSIIRAWLKGRRSLLDYLAGPHFRPRTPVMLDQLRRLVAPPPGATAAR